MAYVSSYDFDIFISYAHVDNISSSDKESGWINRFHKELQTKLDKRIGRPQIIKIWRDNKLDGSQVFNQTIVEKIKKSAIFLAFMSNGYIESEYCQKELNQFHTHANNKAPGLIVVDRSRIFNLLLTNIPYESFPDEIAGTSGFVFHDADSDDDIGVGEPTDPDEKIFRKQLKPLTNAILSCLKKMNAQNQGEKQDSIKTQADTLNLPDPDTDYPVFFADVSDSLRLTQKRVKNDLQAKGVYVIEEKIPPPFDIDSHDKKCSKIAQSSKISIHLFDQYAGREIENTSDSQTYAMKQLQLCLEKSASQLIWVPEALKIDTIEDKIYQDFLKTLEQLPATEKEIELIRGNRDSIITGVVEKIKKMKQSLKSNIPSENKTAVLLDTHEIDNLYAFNLINYLSGRDISIRVNPNYDTPQENIIQFEECLQSVNALMLVYGNVTKDFIVARMLTIMSMIIENKVAIQTQAIFLAPPKKESEIKELKKIIPNVQLLDNSDQPQLNPEVLTPFFECIGCGGAS